MGLLEINKGTEKENTQVENTGVILSNFDKIFSELIGEEDENKNGIKLTEEGFNLAKDILMTYSLGKQEQISKLMIEKKIKFENYFYDNGFPNIETKNNFEKFLDNEFGIKKEDVIDKKEDVIDKKKDVIDKKKDVIDKKKDVIDKKKDVIDNVEKENQTQKEILNDIKNDISGYEKKFDKLFIEYLDNSDTTGIIEYLDKGENLKNILILLKDIDKENGRTKTSDNSLYTKITSQLKNLSPSFTVKIQEFENQSLSDSMKLSSTKPFDQAIITASLTTDKNIITHGSRKEAVDSDGDNIFVDTAEVPPLRQIALNGSDYRMETDVPVGDFYEATVNYETAKKELVKREKEIEGFIKVKETKLGEIESRISDIDEIEKISGELSPEDKLIKENLLIEKEKLINEIIDLENDDLRGLYAEFDELEEQYKADLKAKVQSYSDKMKLRDLETKETLQFLEQTGFDILPQTLTNQIIREFQGNIFDIPGLNLNPKTMDLENGQFGETENESDGDKWKDNLVKFMDKMLYGEIGTENSIFKGKNFKGEFGANINPLDFNKALDESGIKTGIGWNINVMRNNLSKEVK